MLAAGISDRPNLPVDPNVVLTNLFLTMLVVLLFGVTSALFNSTIDENRAEITGWFARVRAPLALISGPVGAIERTVTRAGGGARLGAVARVATILGVTGLIYGFLSPDFGLNAASLILFVALVVGVGIVTYVAEGGSTLLATRRFHAAASVRLYGAAIAIAIACVAMSRLTDFRPGFMYGFVASSLILGGVVLDRRRSADLVIWPSLALLAVSLGAWLLLGPLRAAAAADGSWAPVLATTVAAVVFVAGLEGFFYNMIPLTFMDGATIYRWNRLVWAIMFGTATFLFWQLVINGYSSYLDALRETSVQICLIMLALFGGITLAIWVYFRSRRRTQHV